MALRVDGCLDCYMHRRYEGLAPIHFGNQDTEGCSLDGTEAFKRPEIGNASQLQGKQKETHQNKVANMAISALGRMSWTLQQVLEVRKGLSCVWCRLRSGSGSEKPPP